MISYQVELVTEVLDEIKPLLRAHYEEISTDKEIRVLDPDYDKYIQLNEMGGLRVFTVRDDGVLIGYFVTLMTPHIHYMQTEFAMNDIMYLDPGHRGGTVGYRMVKLAIEDLKNLGVEVLIIHMKVEYPFRELLSKLGFNLREENWELII